MYEIDKIIDICLLNSNDEYRDQFKQFQKQHCNANNNHHMTSSNNMNPSLSYKINMLKTHVEDFKKYFLYKQEEVL